jgi:hypothetical protein
VCLEYIIYSILMSILDKSSFTQVYFLRCTKRQSNKRPALLAPRGVAAAPQGGRNVQPPVVEITEAELQALVDELYA